MYKLIKHSYIDPLGNQVNYEYKNLRKVKIVDSYNIVYILNIAYIKSNDKFGIFSNINFVPISSDLNDVGNILQSTISNMEAENLINLIDHLSVNYNSDFECFDESGDVGFSYDYKIKKWEFGFFFSEDSYIGLFFNQGINLFHNYFQSYKILVEKYLPEDQKQETITQDWWSKFLEELSKLEKIYNELVENGEIEEAKFF